MRYGPGHTPQFRGAYVQIDINKFVRDSLEAEQGINAQLATLAQTVKSFGYGGTGFDGFSLMDLFGEPGASAIASSASRDIEQVRGWNFTAILAKALQFGIGNAAVYCPKWMAESICQQHGEEYKASKRVTGTEQYGVPEDWVTAPRQHRIARILNQPNPWCDQSQFLFAVASQTEAHGICHILVLPNPQGLPSELWVIPRTAIQPLAPSMKFPEGSYRIGHLSRLSINMRDSDSPQSLQQALGRISNREYSAKYIITIGLPSLVFADDCINVSSAIADTLDTDRQIHLTRRNVLERQMTTGPRLEPMPGVTISNEEWSKTLDEFEATNTGPSRAGAPWRPPAGIKVTSDQKTGREMEYVSSADQSKDHVLGQRLMPAAMMGLGDGGSYAQVVGLIKGNTRLVLQPLMRIYSGQLTIGLRRFFSAPQDQFMAIMQAASIDDPEQRRGEFNLLVDAGAMRKGELREAFNMMPFGDKRDDELAGKEAAAAGDAPGGAAGTGLPTQSGGLDRPNIGNPEANVPQITPAANNNGQPSATEKSASLGQLSRRQFLRNQRAIMDTLSQFESGQLREKTAFTLLKTMGLSPDEAQEFIDSVKDPVTGAAQDMKPEASALFARAMSLKGIVDDAAHTTATSPRNMLRKPTEEQCKTGQYKKGRFMVAGMTIEFENPQGSIRSGRRPDGSRWAVEMQDHYGYIVGAVGYDKDQLDVFIKPGTEPDWDGDVYVINQANADGTFDEHKCFIGCQSKKEAIARYLDNYDDDWTSRIMSVVAMPLFDFKLWMLDPKFGPMAGECTAQGTKLSLFTRAMTLKDATSAASGTQAQPAKPKRDGDGDGVINDGTPQEQPAQPEQQPEQLPKKTTPPTANGTSTEATHRVMFEAAPDPNDTALTDRWRALSNDDRIRISRDVVKEIMPDVSEMLGVDVSLQEQLGGYLDDTNPSFAAQFPKGISPDNFIKTMKSTGFILSQDSMMGISQNPIEGGEKVGFVTVNIPEGQDVHDLYMKIRSLDNSVQGHTTVGNQMLIVDFTGQSERIANTISSGLNVQAGYADGYAAFVSKDQYGYESETNQGNAAGVAEEQRRTNDLRRKASAIIERNISAIESANAAKAVTAATAAKVAGFTKAISQDHLRALAQADAAQGETVPEEDMLSQFDPATIERAELIADIMYELYGDDAARQLANGGDFAKLASVFGKAWDESKIRRHPQGTRTGGRFAPKNSAEYVTAAHSAIDEALRGNRAPESAARLVDSLSGLTVAQLHEIKRKYNMKASGRTKKELVAKIAARLDAGRRADHSSPSLVDRSNEAARVASQAAIGSAQDARSNDQAAIQDRVQRLEAAAQKNQDVAQSLRDAEYRVPLADQHERVAQALQTTAADLRAIPQETQEQIDQRVKDSVLTYLRNNPNARLSDIARAVNIPAGPAADPLQSPLNRALVSLRDSGSIMAIESRWGSDPQFRALSEQDSRALTRFNALKDKLPAEFVIAQGDSGQDMLVLPNRTRPLPLDPRTRLQILEEHLRRHGYEPDNVLNGIEETTDQRAMRSNFNRKSAQHQQAAYEQARQRLETLMDKPVTEADIQAHLFNLRPNDPVMIAANEMAIEEQNQRQLARVGASTKPQPQPVAQTQPAPQPAPAAATQLPRFSEITNDRDMMPQINRTLEMQTLRGEDLEPLFDIVPNMQHDDLASYIAERRPDMRDAAENIRSQLLADIRRREEAAAAPPASPAAASPAAASPAPEVATAESQPARVSPADMTPAQRRTALKKIGADFLDDITPDEDGNLIQYRPSKGTVVVVDNSLSGREAMPRSWNEVPAEQQAQITESYRAELRRTLRNSYAFKHAASVAAQEEAERRVDAMPDSELAHDLVPRLQQMRGYGWETIDHDGVMNLLAQRNPIAVERLAILRTRKINETKAELLDGRRSWMRQRFQQELARRTEVPDTARLFEHATHKGLLQPVRPTVLDNFLTQHGLKRQDLASLIGLPDSWTVKAQYVDYGNGGQINLEVGRQDSAGNASMNRTIRTARDGGLEVYNSSFFMNDDAPKGLGLDIFSRAVGAARQLGLKRIATMPCRSSTMVGYAVWPQFGYDADIDQISDTDVRERTRRQYPNARTIRDIYDTPGGQEWWWQNGGSINSAKFDVTPGSRNMKALQAYMSKKKSARDKIRNQA